MLPPMYIQMSSNEALCRPYKYLPARIIYLLNIGLSFLVSEESPCQPYRKVFPAFHKILRLLDPFKGELLKGQDPEILFQLFH